MACQECALSSLVGEESIRCRIREMSVCGDGIELHLFWLGNIRSHQSVVTFSFVMLSWVCAKYKVA